MNDLNQVSAGGTGTQAAASEKGFVPALLLAILLGGLGVHRFYVGKIGTGILMILTLGGLGIWTLVDIIMIAVGSFTDKQGLPIKVSH
ncbi:MAG: TM2 domain-containing protein [Gammaproteobacteria bacterium]|nr:TM2 domain-containing protein [Gammaproteobacteria bacterium]